MPFFKAHISAVVVSAVVLLAASWLCWSYTESGYAPSYPDGIVSNAEEISAEEVNAFLKTWRRYKTEKIDELGFTDWSMVTNSTLSEANPDITRWLKRKRWNAERFFHVENRLKMIVTTILKDEEIARSQKLMLEQATEGVQNKELSAVLLRDAHEQNKKFNVERISSEEYELIRPRLEEVMSLLEMNKAN